MELLKCKILITLSIFFSTGQPYEEITIKENIIKIELSDGTIIEERIKMISPEAAKSP